MLRSLVSIVIFVLLTGVANAQLMQSACSRLINDRGTTYLQRGTIYYGTKWSRPPTHYANYVYYESNWPWRRISLEAYRGNSHRIVDMYQCPMIGGVVTHFSGGGVYYSPNCRNLRGGGYTQQVTRWEQPCKVQSAQPAPRRRR
jgi:hypothetical protein